MWLHACTYYDAESTVLCVYLYAYAKNIFMDYPIAKIAKIYTPHI